MSPYEMLFVQNPPLLQLPSPPDPGDYSIQLQHKLVEMWEMVEANMTDLLRR